MAKQVMLGEKKWRWRWNEPHGQNIQWKRDKGKWQPASLEESYDMS